MGPERDDNDPLLPSVPLEGEESILAARQRAEQEVRAANEALERKTEELRKQSEWLRVTLLSIGDGVIATDTQGRITAMNPVAETLTGWTAPDALGRDLQEVFRIIHEFTRQPVANPAIKALQQGTTVALANHTLLIARDGSELPIDDSAAPIRDDAGALVGAVLVFRDVTERRRADEAQRRLAAIVASSDDAIVGKSLDGLITSWNAGAERLYGYSAAEILGKPFSILIPPDRPDDARESARRLHHGERLDHFETVRIRKDGSRIDVSVSYSPIKDPQGHVVGIAAITRDISERKRAEQAIRASQRQLQFVADTAPVMIAHCDTQQCFKFVNRPYAERFGLHPKDLTGKSIAAVIGEEAYAAIAPHVGTVLRGQRVEFEAEVPYESLPTQHLLCSYEPELSGDGKVVGYVAAITNISERKRIERALQKEARTTETLYRIGRTLADELNLRQIVQTVVDEATNLTGAQLGAFFNSERREQGEWYATSIAARDAFSTFPMPGDTQIFQPTFRGQDVIRLDDVTMDPRYGKQTPDQGNAAGNTPVRSYLAAPVLSRSGNVLGGLFFAHAEAGVFTERHEQLIRGIAAHAAVAIDNARLYSQLRESEQRFRQLAENIREVFWISDPQKNSLLFVSPAYEEVWGRSRASLYDQPLSFFHAIDPQDRPRVQTESLDKQARGEPTDVKYRVIRPDGTRCWVRDRSFPVKDEQGVFYRTVGIAEDISERRQAEERARFLAEASAALSAVVDYESTLQRVAGLAVPAFADWCAVDLTEPDETLRRLAVVHSDPAKVQVAEELVRLYPPSPDAPHGPYRVLRSGESDWLEAIDETLLRTSATDEQHLAMLQQLGLKSFVCVPLRSRNKALGVLTFVYAESGRRYQRSDLTLAEELGRRAATAIENARLYADLREADRRKDEFLAMLAHELRNPLAPIRSGLDLLAMERGKGNQDDTIEVMQQQVAHLTRLVDDLLDVSRIVRGRIELRRERVDLAATIRQSVETVGAAAKARNQQLVVSLPNHAVWLDADPVRLVQVVENLLNNASKYTDEGGRIELLGVQRDGQAIISVQDNGIGIDRDLLPKVFDLFTQSARSLDRAQGGLGIGLTLVRSLVKLHGGEVTAFSEGPGAGSRFEVALPISAAAPAEVRNPQETTPSYGRRVMVVDDSVGAAQMMALLVKRLGPYEVQLAHDGPSALELAKQFRPEIILLDIGLPRMDGLSVAWTLRQSSEFDGTLLVALTGYGQEEDRRKSREAGFDEHFVKPIGVDALRQLLSHPKLK